MRPALPTPGVRARILATVLGLTALGMSGAGLTTVVMQRNALDDRVNSGLRTEVDEFRAIAAQGRDPVTGAPYTSVEELLRDALRKQAPDRDETFLTLVDGRRHLVPAGERFVELDEVPGLVRRIAAQPVDAPVRLREADSPAGPIRYAAVGVRSQTGTSTGSYVVAYSLQRNQDEIASMARRFALVAAVSLLVVGTVGWLVAGRLLAPLRRVRETADRISDTDLTERIAVTGQDDVSELAATFNRMLDRLEQAFGTQQQFLDDAGHELRTPITIIRGHLELLSVGDPDEVAQVRDLVIDELDRMGRLVQDLILLAKTRRPDFLHAGPLLLAELTDDVLVKASGLGRRSWRVDARADAVVVADGQRLTQALLQLAANAVQHTREGQVVAVGSAVAGSGVRLWVRDEGPGVDPADAARIFERFARGTGETRHDGSGLGLSIVAAIAAAHGGHVELQDDGRPGARFDLVLPLRTSDALTLEPV